MAGGDASRDQAAIELPLTARRPAMGGTWPGKSLELSGLERARGLLEGTLPRSPVMYLTGLHVTEVGLAMSTWAMPASPWWQMAPSVFPAGVLSFLADTAGTAVLTAAPPGFAVTTSELSVDYLRPVSTRSKTLIARSRLIHSTRTLGLAEVSLEDSRGRVLAHGTTRCVLFPMDATAVPEGVHSLEPNRETEPHLLPLEGELLSPEYLNTTPGQEAARRVLTVSPIVHFMGLSWGNAEDGVSVRMCGSEWLTNPGGVVYGGVIALLADVAASAAMNSVLPPVTSFGVLDMKTSFLRPALAQEGDLIGTGRIVHQGRSIAIVESRVENERGKAIAIASASMLLLPGRPWARAVNVSEELGPATSSKA